MIEDSKWVQKVESNAPKKGWKITWHDDKKDNIFDESWLKLLDEAQKDKRLVHFTKEKNNAGYWNILTLELVDGSELPPAETVETHHTDVKPDPPQISGQEMGMWWNNLGARIGDGSLEKAYPKSHIKIKGQYYKKMFTTLGIELDNKNIEE